MSRNRTKEPLVCIRLRRLVRQKSSGNAEDRAAATVQKIRLDRTHAASIAALALQRLVPESGKYIGGAAKNYTSIVVHCQTSHAHSRKVTLVESERFMPF